MEPPSKLYGRSVVWRCLQNIRAKSGRDAVCPEPPRAPRSMGQWPARWENVAWRGGLATPFRFFAPPRKFPVGRPRSKIRQRGLKPETQSPEGKGGPRCPPPPPPPPAESRAWGGAHGRNPACPYGGRGRHLTGTGGKSTHGTAGDSRG